MPSLKSAGTTFAIALLAVWASNNVDAIDDLVG